MTEIAERPDLRAELLRRRLQGTAQSGRPAGIPRAPRDGAMPLSFTQRQLWILDQIKSGTTEYLMTSAVGLRGRLNVAALRQALDQTVAQHEILRTRYRILDGEPVQVIDPPMPVRLAEIDLSALEPEARRRRLAELTSSDREPVHLATGPVISAVLARLAEDHHALLVTVHHIASDGWSEDLLLTELGRRYQAVLAGRPEPVDESVLQYADYAAWQRAELSGTKLTTLAGYWRKQLGGLQQLELPTDHSRPSVPDATAAQVAFTVPATTAQAVRKLAHKHGATPFMAVLAALKILLSRYAGQTDVAVGTPVAGRDRPETHGLLGILLNTVVLRTDLSGNPTFGQLLDRVRETALAGFSHQEMPFTQILEELVPGHNWAQTPLFSTMFLWEDGTGGGRSHFGSLDSEPLPVAESTAKFDLTVSLAQRPDGSWAGGLTYASALFDATTMTRFADALVRLIGAVAAAPDLPIDELDLLGEADRHELVQAWNDTDVTYPITTLAELIAEQVRRTPDATAVRFEGASLSYRECDRRAGRLAAELRARGVGPESIVAVRMQRGIELPLALLAVIKAGGAYLPLDPTYPASRIEYLLSDSRAGVLLTDQPAGGTAVPELDVRSLLAGSADEVAAVEDADDTDSAGPRPDNPAYLIYTSGSTGRPKGVLVSHCSIVNRLLWMQQTYQLDHTDRVLQKTPYSFDVSVWEFFWPLITGACLVMATPEGHRDPGYLAKVIEAEQITTLHFVPSMLRAFLAQPLTGLPSLRRMVCSGEALSADLVTAVAERIGCELHNLYGPTEAAVDVTAIQCVPGTKVTIGRPVANTRTYIVDQRLRPVPVGVPGELMLAGVQLARGYFGKPALTAERFIPDPFATEPGQRLYRTGDRARYLADGTIEYLGRLDHQVKIRGNRIELGEVEAVLNEHPGVAAAAAAVHDEQLVGYLTGEAVDPAAVQEYLRERLPDAMVPSRWVVLDELPLTSSGKVERKALPRPAADRLLAGSYVAPRTPTEELVAEAFANALGLDRVGVEDRFSDLGGDSIRAIRAVGAMRGHGLDLSVLDLLTQQTVGKLAGLGSTTPGGALTEEWVRPWQLIGDQDRARLGPDIVDAYPIGQLQAGMLYEMAAGLSGNTYQNVTGFAMIDELPFSLPALQAAAEALVDRHEILRTSFHLTGFSEPMQLVHARVPIAINCTDLRQLAPAEQRAAIEEFWEQAKRQPFELDQAPLVRWHMHLTGEREWTLTHIECHAILDGWSHHSVIGELRASYRSIRDGHGTGLSPLPPVRFADFILLERKALDSEADREFWRNRLQRFGRLELPMNLGRPTHRPADDGPVKHPEVHVSWADLIPQLRALVAESQTSMKTVMHTAHLTVLGAITGQRQFHSGVVSNGRPEALGSDLVRGMFLNTLPFAVELAQPSWRALLQSVHGEELAEWPHRRYPLPAMQRAWGEERPLLPSIFGYLDFHVLAEEEASMGDITDDSPNEFTLDVWTFPGEWRLACHPDWADQERLEGIAAAHLDVLRAMVADIEADPASVLLPSLVEPDPSPNSADSLPECSVPELVTDQVRRRPDAVAVQFGQQQLSYAELDRRSNQLAHWLIARGVGPETPVAVRMQRSLEVPVAMLGILKAGGFYVPLDPEHPDERSRFALDDTGAQLLVTQPGFAGAFGELDKIELEPTWAALDGQPEGAPDVRLDPDNASAVLYTSGSTGRPKGIQLSHRNIVRRAHDSNWTDLDEHQVFLLVSPMAFDASTMEIWAPLCNGGRVAIAPPETPTAEVIQRLLNEYGVTCLFLTAGLFQHIMETRPTALKGLRHLLSGGDVLSPTHVRTLLELGVAVSNMYGPTECTTFSTRAEISIADTQAALPIGRPLTNTYVRVVDDQLRPVPVGVPGELLIGGPGVTRGYLNRPDLTAERFVPDPRATEPGVRVYRSGDIVWRDLDRVLHFVGRRDSQFKIRGSRIELGEVEAILQELPGVLSATAGVHPDANGNKMLVGYVVPQTGPDGPLADVAGLSELMRRTVPEFMIPTAWAVMTELPLTPNGKIDRKALPPPAAVTTSGNLLAPRNATEQAIADAWAAALGLDRVGVRDDFYALGGHSLLVLRIVSELRERHGYQLSVRSFNQHRTVEGLATMLQGEDAPTEAMEWLRREGSQVPLFCVHPGGGSAHWYRPLAEYLDADLPVAAFGWPGLQGDRDSVPTAEQMAARYLAELRAAAPHGPYRLFSWCGGSGIASEMAHTLRAAGETVTFILLDPGVDSQQRPELWKEYRLIQQCVDVLELLRDAPASTDTTELRTEALRLLEHLVDDVDPAIGIRLPERGAGDMWLPEARMWEEVMLMVLTYQHRPYDGSVHLIVSDELADGAHEVASGQTYEQYLERWRELATEITEHRMPGDHFSVIRPPHIAKLAGLITELLDGAR